MIMTDKDAVEFDKLYQKSKQKIKEKEYSV